MKTIVLLLIVIMSSFIFLPSCQKDSINNSSKPVDTKSFNVIVDTVGTMKYGTANPVVSIVKKGGSLTISFTTKPGCKMSGLIIDGTSVTIASSYTFTNIQKDHTIRPTFIADPTAVYFTITADTVGTAKYGTVNPTLSQVIKGGSLSVSFTSKPGCRMNGLTIDGSKVAVVNPYVFTNIQVNHTIKPSFTDSLTLQELDAIKNLILWENGHASGTWYDVADSSKLAGMSLENDPFVVIPIPDCAKDLHDVYFANGTSKSYEGASPCSPVVVPNSLVFTGTWKLSSNGKTFDMYDASGNFMWTITIIKLTSTDFVYQYATKGILYKFLDKHTPAK
jgi:metal-sulfur cluster biosynthetic enzyme